MTRALTDAYSPKLFTALRGYAREQCLADVTAGIIVAIVALPLAIAFAIASGVTPDRGLYTAIIAGFLISALGGWHWCPWRVSPAFWPSSATI